MPLQLCSQEIDELVGELESLLKVSAADAVRFALKNEVARVKAMGRLRLSLAHLEAKRMTPAKPHRAAEPVDDNPPQKHSDDQQQIR